MQTNLLALPRELLARIFSRIHPHSVARYRLLCHTINAMLSSRSFAVENLSRFISSKHIGKVDLKPRADVYKKSGLVIDADETCVNANCKCEMKVYWFRLPSNHQEVYFAKYLSHPIVITSLEYFWVFLQSHHLPAQLGRLTTLVSLRLISLGLNGPIPMELGELINLKRLNLSYNALSGPVLPEIGSLIMLEELILNHNKFTGNIPLLGNLMMLKNLSLSSNQLTGEIPTELGQLSNLQYLYLSSNRLSGSIPSSFVQLEHLRHLMLQENQLSGSICHLGMITSLDNLMLGQNLLELLDLKYNQLSGLIPEEFGGLCRLAWLFLNNNQLEGSIPASFANLCGNRLTGSLPPGLLSIIEANNGNFTI
ncbi:L domain-like protein [Rhizoclosmatium globosum]|uniref:L domain-like protein n=1 Tax=Rhizoclosmatium globosum TaxID=329046 RepID=A0A1Y2BUS9_9FUNG|nr:L domain-like protein [Rhizoclosmatium globosum]|eukprot:ORY38528.1 L domain-like protein [Rhizoclosmatium globosum]